MFSSLTILKFSSYNEGNMKRKILINFFVRFCFFLAKHGLALCASGVWEGEWDLPDGWHVVAKFHDRKGSVEKCPYKDTGHFMAIEKFLAIFPTSDVFQIEWRNQAIEGAQMDGSVFQRYVLSFLTKRLRALDLYMQDIEFVTRPRLENSRRSDGRWTFYLEQFY